MSWELQPGPTAASVLELRLEQLLCLSWTQQWPTSGAWGWHTLGKHDLLGHTWPVGHISAKNTA